jgi:putative PIN family toxin of toxin-antitoxin system
MIITFDAAILVRATARATGPARRALDLVIDDPRHTLALSRYILGEVGKTLAYSKMQTLYRLTGQEIHDFVEFLGSVAEIVEPAQGIPVVLADPADDPVIYTAVAAGSDILCTLDKAFTSPNVLEFCARQDIRVMDDVSLLRFLEKKL